MLGILKLQGKPFYKKEPLIEHIKEVVSAIGEDLKELIINDFSLLLTHEDLLKVEKPANTLLYLNNNVKNLTEYGSRVVANTYSAEQEIIRLDKEKRNASLNLAFAKSRIPKMYRDKTSLDVKPRKGLQKTFEVVRDYAKNFDEYEKDGKGLFIFGGVGSGKTLLSSILGNSLVKQGKSVIFYDTTDLFATIRQSFNNSSSLNEEEILRPILNYDLLILDDIGAERPSEWVLEKLFFIVNQRTTNFRPIVLTSNFTNSELMERLGKTQRILSRLLGQSIITQNKATDYRVGG